MCDTHFLTRGTHAQVTTPGQPVGTVIKTPFEPAGPFVELANQQQQFIGGGIDAGRQTNDTAVEFVDGKQPVFAYIYRLNDTSLWSERVPVIIYRNTQKINIKSMS